MKLQDSNIDSGATGTVNVFPARPASFFFLFFFFLKRHTGQVVWGVVWGDTNKKNRFAVWVAETDSQCALNVIRKRKEESHTRRLFYLSSGRRGQDETWSCLCLECIFSLSYAAIKKKKICCVLSSGTDGSVQAVRDEGVKTAISPILWTELSDWCCTSHCESEVKVF